MIHRAAGQIKIKLDLSGQLRSYSMASINTIGLMSPFRPDKKDTKANDSDRTCVTEPPVGPSNVMHLFTRPKLEKPWGLM